MNLNNKNLLSFSQKNAEKKKWYKEQADLLDTNYYALNKEIKGVSDFKRMKVNYDLFNNKINIEDFNYVCKPYGSKVGELPASMVNRDIVSGKIKAMLGMETKRPFAWNVVATNPEATTRKEQEEFKRIKDFIISKILGPIKEQIEIEKLQSQQEGKKLSQEQIQQIKDEIEQEVQTQTPEEVKKYMKREHQDPSEVMASQLLHYLIQKRDLKRKFNIAFKHGLISAVECLYVGILNGEPEVWNVNSMRINSDKSPDLDFIEDGEWVTCEYRMTPSSIMKYFGDQLKNEEIERIYSSYKNYNVEGEDVDLFTLNDIEDGDVNAIKVLHCVWKAPRKIGFLTYDDGQERLVDESYELDKDLGDISIEWEQIPEVYETWKIKTAEPIYVNMRPLPGQTKDINNIYDCKLPYYGAIYDNLNSEATSLMDRMRDYQYFYNIVWYRLELLLASDKGKKVLMNIGSIPASSGIDLEKWQYFFEATPFMYFNPNEEGTNYQDANTTAKVVDLSMASDIQKYIEILEYLRIQTGKSVGITDNVEGQISPTEAVGNANQNLIQSSYILEMYFELHNLVKRNVLQALIETAKIAYSDNPVKHLSYVLDDMSIEMFNFDVGLLDNSTIGLFVANSTKAEETKDIIRQLTHAALQNQKVELSDVISVLKQESIAEAEETLKVAEDNRRGFEQTIQQQQQQALAEEAEKAREFERERHEMEKEKIILKEEERRKTAITQASIVGLSFNPELDQDHDNIPDFMEIAKHGLDAEIKRDKLELEKNKLEQKKKVDDAKIKNDKEKLKMQKAKNLQKS